MKLILFFVVSCLVLHNGKGAPATAVYKFVRCNPEGDQVNCVTHQTPEMAWSPDLPAKLPASTVQYLEAQPVEDESTLWEEVEEEEQEEEDEEDEMLIQSEEGESPEEVSEDGSGGYEGSAGWGFVPFEGDKGSGESWTEEGVDTAGQSQFFPSVVRDEKPEEQELRDDHLLKP